MHGNSNRKICKGIERSYAVKPDIKFSNQAKDFWANVRTISQKSGYTERGTHQVKTPNLRDIEKTFSDLGLSTRKIVDSENNLTKFGKDLLEYFQYRAATLNTFVEPRLMDVEKAKKEFLSLKEKLSPSCPLPMNKQKGNKKSYAFLTGIINMIIESNAKGVSCDYDPRELTTITQNKYPLRTLARRIDGAFPRVINPIAVWEIKEYYYTTTFGSRVADGVYESLLDGMELEELYERENKKVLHYLMIDSHYTWWDCGRSYLCRIIDMLNMKYLDEVLFGYEIIEKLPCIVEYWVSLMRDKKNT